MEICQKTDLCLDSAEAAGNRVINMIGVFAVYLYNPVADSWTIVAILKEDHCCKIAMIEEKKLFCVGLNA
jgi:hypothetical protein